MGKPHRNTFPKQTGELPTLLIKLAGDTLEQVTEHPLPCLDLLLGHARFPCHMLGQRCEVLEALPTILNGAHVYPWPVGRTIKMTPQRSEGLKLLLTHATHVRATAPCSCEVAGHTHAVQPIGEVNFTVCKIQVFAVCIVNMVVELPSINLGHAFASMWRRDAGKVIKVFPHSKGHRIFADL